jgi:REP element-mobilizing transposase RayT
MPFRLKRFHHSGQSHFVTFCCYHRRVLFGTAESRRVFEKALERVAGGPPFLVLTDSSFHTAGALLFRGFCERVG